MQSLFDKAIGIVRSGMASEFRLPGVQPHCVRAVFFFCKISQGR